MEFLIVSGMSGAGKTKVATCLEDLGYYCVDNMPGELIPKFAEICVDSNFDKVALVVDIRTSRDFDKLFKSVDLAKDIGYDFKILYLDAKDSILINRFKETRRRHPMSHDNVSLTDAIKKERDVLELVRNRADFVVDTSYLSLGKLREHILNLFIEKSSKTLITSVVTFGFKHGAPHDVDMMFDVRFLPNPYYDLNLRAKTGLSEDVREYVFKDGVAEEFSEKLKTMIDFLIPHYITEGKTSLSIGIGCTGGKHRSVAIGEEIIKHLKNKEFNVDIKHRDKDKL